MVFHEEQFSSDDSASIPTVHKTKHLVVETDGLKGGRDEPGKVRFNEAENVYHYPPRGDNTAQYYDPQEFWYTERDIVAFHDQAKQLAAQAQEGTSLSSSSSSSSCCWPVVWMRVYFALREATTIEQVEAILDAAPTRLDDETTVGLYDHCLDPIRLDYQMRRQHLVSHVQRLQGISTRKVTLQNRMIRETSLLNSHASRFYAMLVAHAAVGDADGSSI